MWQSHSLLAVIMAVVIAFGTIPGLVAAHNQVVSGSDIDVSIHGGVVEIDGTTAVVWTSESVSALLGPTEDRANEHYIYCLDVDGSEFGCAQGTLPADEGFELTFSEDHFSVGRYQLRARIHEDGLFSNPLLEEVSFTFQVISKEGDEDNDGLANQRELDVGTDYTDADTDNDNLRDGIEINERSSDPLDRDTDDDGLTDGEEVNRYRTDPVTSDTDNDGLNDGREVNEYGTDPTSAHTDGDGLQDGHEVNNLGTDPTKTDTDGDGIDDGAEVQQGSNPTDPDSPNQETQSNQQGVDSTSPQDDSNSEQEADIQRGFFSNDPNTRFAPIRDPLNITTIGFVLSILGILLELRRGG